MFDVVSPARIVLPAIPPENEELEAGESVSQGKAEAVHEEREIAQVEVREDVRVLIILYYHYCCHID